MPTLRFVWSLVPWYGYLARDEISIILGERPIKASG